MKGVVNAPLDGGFFPDEDFIPPREVEDDAVDLPLDAARVCVHCGGMPVLNELHRTFGINVCRDCYRSKIKLITKTECKEAYLLSEGELSSFKCMERANPHKRSWNSMQLFLESEIRRFSIQKHGSAEELEEAVKRKAEQRKDGRMAKLKKNIRKLKQKVFIKQAGERHVHSFRVESGVGECSCGMRVNMEEI